MGFRLLTHAAFPQCSSVDGNQEPVFGLRSTLSRGGTCIEIPGEYRINWMIRLRSVSLVASICTCMCLLNFRNRSFDYSFFSTQSLRKRGSKRIIEIRRPKHVNALKGGRLSK